MAVLTVSRYSHRCLQWALGWQQPSVVLRLGPSQRRSERRRQLSQLLVELAESPAARRLDARPSPCGSGNANRVVGVARLDAHGRVERSGLVPGELRRPRLGRPAPQPVGLRRDRGTGPAPSAVPARTVRTEALLPAIEPWTAAGAHPAAKQPAAQLRGEELG